VKTLCLELTACNVFKTRLSKPALSGLTGSKPCVQLCCFGSPCSGAAQARPVRVAELPSQRDPNPIRRQQIYSMHSGDCI